MPKPDPRASFWTDGDPIVPPFSADAVGELRDLWESDEDFDRFIEELRASRAERRAEQRPDPDAESDVA